MSIKFLNIGTKIYNVDEIRNIADLEEKVDYFLSWYKRNVDKDVKKVENIIEKVASWYEMRYPNVSIHPKNDIASESSENCNKDNWSEFMDYARFRSLLTVEEQLLLDRPIFPGIVDITPNGSQHFHVDKDGTITDADDVIIGKGIGGMVFNSLGEMSGILTIITGQAMFLNRNLREVEDIVKENQLNKFPLSNVKKVVSDVDCRISVFEGLLDAITCRIIDRGGEYFGPKRGMIFAKEFGRPLDLGIQYGATYYDLVNYYLENGGSEDTLCYLGYFDKYSSGVRSEKLSQLFSNNQVKNLYDKPKVYSKTTGNN